MSITSPEHYGDGQPPSGEDQDQLEQQFRKIVEHAISQLSEGSAGKLLAVERFSDGMNTELMITSQGSWLLKVPGTGFELPATASVGEVLVLFASVTDPEYIRLVNESFADSPNSPALVEYIQKNQTRLFESLKKAIEDRPLVVRAYTPLE